MRKLLITFLLLTAAAYAADFERSNWRAQMYLQAEPAFVHFESDKPQLLKEPIDEERLTVPMSVGFLFSPLYTPLFKADIPFTIWLGAEVNSIQFREIASDPAYWGVDDNGKPDHSEDLTPAGEGRTLSFRAYAPSVVGGFSVNLAGDFDLRVLGGYGMHFFTFIDNYSTSTKDHTEMLPTAFVSGALEYRITEVFQDVDLKIGVNVRKEFLPYEDLKATNPYKYNKENPTPSSGYLGITFDKISYKWPVRIGLELSLDFGRESHRDRRMRFNLRDRDQVLRDNSEVKDTLSDWDCMAIERDYRFFLDENGDLPDMSDAYTKTQFSDVLESFLAFCHPADLATKEKLYATLDSGKVELKEYQVRQEDSRFDQVMASNDPEMLEMFLQYYPDSPRRGEVEAKIRTLSEYHKFREIQAQNTFKAYLSYLNDNPNGAFRDEAEAGIFELVRNSNRMKDYEIYLKRFPNGKYVEEAKAALKGANSSAPSQIEYQAPEYVEPPAEEPAVEEPEEEAEEEEEEAPAKVKSKNKKKSKKAAKAAKKKKAKSKKRR
ncbi:MULTISPECIES: hypothetical protein [unclassified Fibrobacter]|jgi:hypothetical protein|uniref:hypothetical protein n=1 Tax=unclassified Fibrobacter TaxID=2634177 RepID=UPI00156358A7|nr:MULTISPECIES: hypothetical protein [unclassified Fibrobacter]